MKVPPRVAAVAFENQDKKCFLIMVSSLQEMPKMVLICLKLIWSGTFAILTLNLCGFDPGLEAGSR